MSSGGTSKRCRYLVVMLLIVLMIVSLASAYYYARTSFLIPDLQNEVRIDQNTIDSFDNKIAQQQNQLIALDLENSKLHDFLDLTKSTTAASNLAVREPANSEAQFAAFRANFSGYVLLSIGAASPGGYVRLEDSFPGYPYRGTTYSLTAGSTLVLPVLPGEVNLFFGSVNQSDGSSAILSATYYF